MLIQFQISEEHLKFLFMAFLSFLFKCDKRSDKDILFKMIDVPLKYPVLLAEKS